MSKIFISYARSDGRDFAHDVRLKLEENGLDYWMDVDEITIGEEWPRKIDEALRDSFALILILTSGALKSVYVTYEWIFALGRGIKVFPIKVANFDEVELHPKLRVTNYDDFTTLKPNSWNKLIDELLKVRAEYDPYDIAGGLSTNSPRFVQNALLELDNTNEHVRRKAIDILATAKHPVALQAIAGAVKHPYPDVSIYAAFTLAEKTKYQDTRALPGLLEGMRDGNDDIRKRAARMLKEFGTKSAKGLIETLKDSYSETRCIAAITLGELKEKSAVPFLIPLLDDAHDKVVDGTLTALELIEDSSVIPVLKEKLAELDHNKQLRICQILLHFNDHSIISNLAKLVKEGDINYVAQIAAGLLIDIGQDSVPYMIEVLDDQTDKWWTGRAIAASTLGRLGNIVAVPHLKNALSDKHGYVRGKAAEALGRMRIVEAVQKIGELLKDDDLNARNGAAWALEMIDTEEARNILSHWRETR